MPERPLGVTIICILYLIIIILGFFSGIVFSIFFGEIKTQISKLPEEVRSFVSTYVTFILIFTFLSIGANLVVIIGLWTMTKWGFASMIYLQVLSILNILIRNFWKFQTIKAGFGFLAPIATGFMAIGVLIQIAIPVIILLYLLTKKHLVFEKRETFYVEGMQLPTEITKKDKWLTITIAICLFFTITTIITSYFELEITSRMSPVQTGTPFGKMSALTIDVNPKKVYLGQRINISIKLSENETSDAKIEIDPSSNSLTISTRSLVITGDIYSLKSTQSHDIKPATISKDQPYTFSYDLNFLFENPEDMVGEYKISMFDSVIYKIDNLENAILISTSSSPFYIDEVSTDYVTDPDLKNYYDAILLSDYELCKNIAEDESTVKYRNLCFSKAALATNNSDYCSGVVDQRKRDNCYYTIATDTNKYEPCEKITDLDNKDKCLFEVARTLKDSSICEKISDLKEKDNCFYFIGDCDKIQTQITRESCYKIYRVAYCGDGKCGEDENCTSCEKDCGVCPCGDGFCDFSINETCSSCPEDCACPEGFECISNICMQF